MHAIVKSGCSERDKVFRISVFANAFSVLDKLAAKKNAEAPVMYKVLI